MIAAFILAPLRRVQVLLLHFQPKSTSTCTFILILPELGSYYQDNSLLLSSPSLSSRGFHNSFASRVKSARLNPFSSSPLPSSSPVYFVNPTYQAVGASLDTQSVDSLFSKASASLSSHRSRSSYSPLKSTSTRPYSPPREPFPVSPSMRYSYPGPGTYSPETSLHSSSSYSIHESSSFISQAPRIAQIPLPS